MSNDDKTTEMLKSQKDYTEQVKQYKDKPKSRPVSSGGEWNVGFIAIVEFAEFNGLKLADMSKCDNLTDGWTTKDQDDCSRYILKTFKQKHIEPKLISSPQ